MTDIRKPEGLGSKIFLDGGDVAQTRQIIDALGWLDGQTTNPSLIAKNPAAQERLAERHYFSTGEIATFYKGVVQEVSSLIPEGSVSIEVTADDATTTEQMLGQAREMNTWIPNAHIKFPTTAAGLEAAEIVTKEGMRVNMTLCFSQQQAAAVYAATRGAQSGDVFVSPFIGRFDDRGDKGIDTIANIARMYDDGDGHVLLLAASVRTTDHLLWCLAKRCDIITAPAKVLQEWAEMNLPVPDPDFDIDTTGLEAIPYEEVELEQDWRSYNLQHDLTDQGIIKFTEDWNELLGTN